MQETIFAIVVEEAEFWLDLPAL